MRKHLTLGLILSSALALTSVAMAAGPDGHQGGREQGRSGHGHQRGHGRDMAFSKLDLTDAQRASIKQIRSSNRAQHKGQRIALRQQREAFRSMTPDQVGYQAAAARLAQAEGNATQARVQQRANVRAQIYAVLTPAQKAKLATMRSERQARREQWKSFKAQHPVDGQRAPSAQ